VPCSAVWRSLCRLSWKTPPSIWTPSTQRGTSSARCPTPQAGISVQPSLHGAIDRFERGSSLIGSNSCAGSLQTSIVKIPLIYITSLMMESVVSAFASEKMFAWNGQVNSTHKVQLAAIVFASHRLKPDTPPPPCFMQPTPGSRYFLQNFMQVNNIGGDSTHKDALGSLQRHYTVNQARFPATIVSCRTSYLIGWNSHTKLEVRRPLRQSLKRRFAVEWTVIIGLYAVVSSLVFKTHSSI
jgi:hypothetical protein